ncbi:DUF4145 domain-containing protein [Thalassotalea fusca]
MLVVKTDLEFAKLFSLQIHEHYQTALEFLDDNPDYSLLKFRKIIELLSNYIAEKRAIDFQNDNLFEQINILFEEGIIPRHIKNNFHELRMLCNDGVHNKSSLKQTDDADFAQSADEAIKSNAKQSRTLIVELFEDLYLHVPLGKELPKFELVDTKQFGLKQIIFDAAIDTSYQAKLKAGIAYQAIAKNNNKDSGLIVSNSFSFNQESLLKIAAAYYEAAYKLSSNFDQHFKNSFRLDDDISDKEIIYKYCDTESLFKYAVVAIESWLGKEKEKDGIELLKVAVKRGNKEAVAYYGAFLYDSEEYVESKRYLEQAIEADSALANRYLFYLYSDEKNSFYDLELAYRYLNKAIEYGCIDSIGELGILYHKGLIVEKNDAKAEELLLKAIEKGSYVAKRYHLVEFNDLAGQLQKGAAKFAADFEKAMLKVQQEIEAAKPKPIKVEKIGRNSRCPCGSGKKYKSCCLKK